VTLEPGTSAIRRGAEPSASMTQIWDRWPRVDENVRKRPSGDQAGSSF